MDNIGDSTGYDSVSGESGKSYAAWVDMFGILWGFVLKVNHCYPVKLIVWDSMQM
jgi:hypothetical protein